MEIKLIKGSFSGVDAIDIVTRFVHAKIKFQEEKINHSSNEEDIKMREKRIKTLQVDLNEAKHFITENGSNISVESAILISTKK